MVESTNYCRICLDSKLTNASLYLYVQQKYLPSVIENLCGVVISCYDEPQALICKNCIEALLKAEKIIQKCQESHNLLMKQRVVLQNKYNESSAEKETQWSLEDKRDEEEEKKVDLDMESVKYYQSENIKQELCVEPKMLVESILEITEQESVEDATVKKQFQKVKKVRKKRTCSKSASNDQLHFVETAAQCETNPAALLYQSHFKSSKPKKAFVRSREQYLKRKIRNYPVKEPLKLIGGAGVIGKRKPKSYHRAIANFFFICELCHEFESNVASYAVTHLRKQHGIERPAIFRCSQCDAKPFIKNQSLQEHILTIHEQQPKKRDFICAECEKTFTKNCHLQKHRLTVHKIGEMPFKCNAIDCGKGFAEAYGLRIHMKQVHHIDNGQEIDDALNFTTLYQCDLCQASFNELQVLNSHIKSMHLTDVFSCPYCGYNFRQKARYDAHMKRSKCKPPCFVCRYCEKTFVKLVQLEEHQKLVHLNNR